MSKYDVNLNRLTHSIALRHQTTPDPAQGDATGMAQGRSYEIACNSETWLLFTAAVLKEIKFFLGNVEMLN